MDRVEPSRSAIRAAVALPSVGGMERTNRLFPAPLADPVAVDVAQEAATSAA
jgi:hypothetical protein